MESNILEHKHLAMAIVWRQYLFEKKDIEPIYDFYIDNWHL